MLKKLKYVSLLSKAKNARIKSNFQDAENYMQMAFNVYGKYPQEEFPPYVNIIYASICLHTDKLNSYEFCVIALKQLNKKYYKNINIINYLKYYIQIILINTTNFADSDAYALLKSINIKYNTINANKVPKYIKMNLPLNKELGSEVDAFIESLY
ncbi:MAG: hypothetical protein QM645_06165 [Asticcacaulis sp.]